MIVIYLTETDGDVNLHQCKNKTEAREFIRQKDLEYHGYAVIDGIIIKPFNRRDWFPKGVPPADVWMVTCKNCDEEFDILSVVEVSMGFVLCPGCGYHVNQEGDAFFLAER